MRWNNIDYSPTKIYEHFGYTKLRCTVLGSNATSYAISIAISVLSRDLYDS